MANYETKQRIPSSSPPSTEPHEPEPKGPQEMFYANFQVYCPINIPSTSEAAGVRIMRNIGSFGLYYTLFRKVSLILLVIMTYVTTVYCLILRSFPNSAVLHRIIDKRVVLALLAVATAVQLILTEAGIHLAVTLASSVPLVLLHAVLWANFDAFVVESGKGEMVPLTGHEESVAESNFDAV
uniref:PRA1 family protein n=1 Tax=Phaseolus vulgaris TaxID=3885 RepID=V7B476_PHAVU|nr:hypothetical protein PHAVU_008G048500g [Phaseolus vulgaris]ESW11653.1 hypothetical protein PHAVU_008G048500g [Phaseolus vulgaris]